MVVAKFVYIYKQDLGIFAFKTHFFAIDTVKLFNIYLDIHFYIITTIAKDIGIDNSSAKNVFSLKRRSTRLGLKNIFAFLVQQINNFNITIYLQYTVLKYIAYCVSSTYSFTHNLIKKYCLVSYTYTLTLHLDWDIKN
ncbi:unnamed protein product [Callosobruchus maculatus]|uniref:Uncharacterized protein n=1 Tax=Callosobruchus maculatus TaxID=64391 RepID=A0A653DP00_CALMS|nr:unnamed protein product [Callosobruchus maculatus]